MKRVRIEIGKRLFLMILIFLLVAALATISYAYNSNNPTLMGHSADEVTIDIGGVTKTLQTAIDDNSLMGPPGPQGPKGDDGAPAVSQSVTCADGAYCGCGSNHLDSIVFASSSIIGATCTATVNGSSCSGRTVDDSGIHAGSCCVCSS